MGWRGTPGAMGSETTSLIITNKVMEINHSVTFFCRIGCVVIMNDGKSPKAGGLRGV